MSYEVDLWQKLATAQTANDWRVTATEADLAAARLALINQVVSTYFNLCYLNANYTQNQRNLARYEKLQDTTAGTGQPPR